MTYDGSAAIFLKSTRAHNESSYERLNKRSLPLLPLIRTIASNPLSQK